jgi:hypothetical protein
MHLKRVFITDQPQQLAQAQQLHARAIVKNHVVLFDGPFQSNHLHLVKKDQSQHNGHPGQMPVDVFEKIPVVVYIVCAVIHTIISA